MTLFSILSSTFVFYLMITSQKCEGAYRIKRIIGGVPDASSDQGFLVALIGEVGYSWDVLKVFGENRKTYCSGSLISDQWIITAAHCFTTFKEIEEENIYENENISSSEEDADYDGYSYKVRETQCEKDKMKKRKITTIKELIDFSFPSYWKVRIAVPTLRPTLKEKLLNFINRFFNISTPNIYYQVTKIIRHPLYNPLYLENDIALMKLKDKLIINRTSTPRIIPITKYNMSDPLWPPPGLMCKVIGWGCKEFEGPIMNRPHSVYLPILKPDYCRKIYRTDINLTESQEFCAGYYDNDKGICAGDSGGPLLCMEDGISVLSGMVSATHVFNPNKYPGIFSRITYFKNWINSVLLNN